MHRSPWAELVRVVDARAVLVERCDSGRHPAFGEFGLDEPPHEAGFARIEFRAASPVVDLDEEVPAHTRDLAVVAAATGSRDEGGEEALTFGASKLARE